MPTRLTTPTKLPTHRVASVPNSESPLRAYHGKKSVTPHAACGDHARGVAGAQKNHLSGRLRGT